MGILSQATELYNKFKHLEHFYQFRHEVQTALGLGDFSDSPVRDVVENMYRNKGELKLGQYQLPPTDLSFCNIENILREVSGDLVLALGVVDEYDCGEYVRWDSVLVLPGSFSDLVKYRFVGRHLTIENREELEKLGLIFPTAGKTSLYNFEKQICAIKSPMVAKLQTQAVNTPEVLGWYSTDFGGYGSRIHGPFEKEVDQDYIYRNLNAIGWMARDLVYRMDEQTRVERMYKYKLIESVLSVASQYEWTVAIGGYPGRSMYKNNNPSKYSDKRTITPKTIEDLCEFGETGLYLVTHKSL